MILPFVQFGIFRVFVVEHLKLAHPGVGGIPLSGVADRQSIVAAGRKPKLKFDVEEENHYAIDLLSGYSGTTAYRIRVKAKSLKGKSSHTATAARRLAVPVYAGAEVKIVVAGKKGFVPDTEIEGLSVPRRTNDSGTKMIFGPFTPEKTEVLTVLVAEGSGKYSVSYRVKVPTTDVPLIR